MTDYTELSEIEFATYDDQQGDGLPRLWWHNGSKKAKLLGSFYVRAEDWAGGLPEPWKADQRFEGEDGWAADVLRILPITYRSQPFARVKDGDKVRRVYYPKWINGVTNSVHTELLCLVEGLEGPVVWSFKGSTGQAVTGKGGIIPTARQTIIGQAEKALKRKVPMHAFWLPIGQRLKDGKPEYIAFTEGGEASPPGLRLPNLQGRDLLNALYAGRDVIDEAESLRYNYEGWRTEKRGTEEDEAPVTTRPQVGNGRNVPQAIDLDSDDPFAPDSDDVL